MNKKEAAEKHLGCFIEDDEYEDALQAATDKLNRINERYGTHHGEEYLAMLIAEQIQFSRFSNYCDAVHRARQAEKRKARFTAHQSTNTNIILCAE